MGRSVRQKRKARSSRPVVRQSNTRKKQLNPFGNDTIAQNWYMLYSAHTMILLYPFPNHLPISLTAYLSPLPISLLEPLNMSHTITTHPYPC